MCYDLKRLIKNGTDLFRLQRNFYLNDGEEICSICGGSGSACLIDNKDKNLIHMYICPKCHGSGKVDWVVNIINTIESWQPSHCTGIVNEINFLTKKKFEDIKTRRRYEGIRNCK
jgi:hypothetical protein